MNSSLPVFLRDLSTKQILHKIIQSTPQDTSVYLFAGTVRNALTYALLKEELPQNDFDFIIIGNGEAFVTNLREAGFEFSNRAVPNQPSARIPRIENPVEKYRDWLYIDCKMYDSNHKVEEILGYFSDFTVSAVALGMDYIENELWQDYVCALPHALEDIQSKQLRVIIPYPASILKVIRMIHQGFLPPSPSEIKVLIESFEEISEEKFKARLEKTIRYVGSREKVVKLAKSIGLSEEIFDFGKLKQL